MKFLSVLVLVFVSSVTLGQSLSLSTSFLYEKHDCDKFGNDISYPSFRVDSLSHAISKEAKLSILNSTGNLGRLYSFIQYAAQDQGTQILNRRMQKKIGATHTLLTLYKRDYCRKGDLCTITLHTNDKTLSKESISCGTNNGSAILTEVQNLIFSQPRLSEERRRREKEGSEGGFQQNSTGRMDHDIAHGSGS